MALLAALGMLSCAGSTELLISDNPMPVSAMVVEPFDVRYPSDPWTSYMHTVEEVSAALNAGLTPVYSYGDFNAFPLDGQDFYAGQNLMSMIAEAGLNQKEVALLRGTATALEIRAPRRAGPDSPVNGDLDIELRVELFHMGNRQVIASGQTRFVAKAIDSAGAGKPHPELTRQHSTLVEKVLDAAAKPMETAASTTLPIQVYEDHERVFRIGTDEQPSIATKLDDMDPIDQSTEILQVYEWFFPEIEPAQLARLQQQDHGLLVVNEPSDVLEPGDVITHAGGSPVVATHQLHRAWANTPPGESLTLIVDRSGTTSSVEWPRGADQ